MKITRGWSGKYQTRLPLLRSWESFKSPHHSNLKDSFGSNVYKVIRPTPLQAGSRQSGSNSGTRNNSKSTSSRRRTLQLLGLSPICCCATCKRNSLLDEVFAQSMATGMIEYEYEVTPVKRMLFRQLLEGLPQQQGFQANILEVGIGTGTLLTLDE